MNKSELAELAAMPGFEQAIERLATNGNYEAIATLKGKGLMPHGQACLETEKWLEQFVSVSPEVTKLKYKTRVLSNYSHSVLIQGETGTGKSLIAHALHGNRKGNFVEINCAGLPEYLVESELFGHVKGAFTDAWRDKVGLFQEAENGTLFLDEVGELSIPLQAKLLKAIEERRIRRVGDTKYITTSCRFIGATHHRLKEEVKENKFRADLLARLAVFTLYIPSILERTIIERQSGNKEKETEAICKRLLKREVLPDDFKTRLERAYPWEENVRTLQKLCIDYEVFVEKIPEL